MSWVAAGVAVVGGVATAVQANKQKKAAARVKPSKWVPPSLLKQKAESDILASSSLAPGQVDEQAAARQNTSQFISNVAKTGGGANELINAASAASGNENRVMRDISRRSLLWKDQRRADRNRINSQIAGQESENRRQWQGAKSALIGAGNQNMFNGISSIGTGIASGLSGQFGGSSPMYRSGSMYGSGNNTTFGGPVNTQFGGRINQNRRIY